MDRDKGILYVATGDQYVREAGNSARSFKKTMPDIPSAIFTDDTALAEEGQCFDLVEQYEDPFHTYADKIAPLKKSPFEKTIFLDADTYSLAPCDEIFDLLDRFDLAVAHAPLRVYYYSPPDCPACFPEINTGVIAYRRTSDFERLVDSWLSIYATQPPEAKTYDQPAFRQALYTSTMRFAILTPEYNLRTCFPFFIGGNAEVKILHDRGESLREAIATLEKSRKVIFPRAIDRGST
jgi:hypothetical protein